MDPARNPAEASETFVTELTDHQTAMLAFIRALMPGSSGARDLLQEVNIILWQKREQFEAGSNFKAWAFQVIRFHLMNHRRRLASKGWLVFDDELVERISPALEADPEELEVRHQALHHCLQKLRPKDRELLQHRYASGAPLNDYAKAINRSPGTLKATLFNLRAALRKCIEVRFKEQGTPLR
ncbi:sigma-70 family RNA polymerase sigma factor [Haloferula sp. BvORR071]|uniref:sigma-70 family RNA polymerase sigma factor n=1 Tax=Haloferula sp. BvORR071 TaxID=1396141 RepID=UPI0005550DC8|nr:sigma-70 family RNA polymerase sigma factor [Haloferula sp. BvORR071]